MKTHLDEQEMTTAVSGLELEPVAEEHLASCLSCRQQVSSMRELIDARRQGFEAEVPDWDQQRQEVLLRLSSASTGGERHRRWVRPLLALAAILVAAIGLRMLWAPPLVDRATNAELPVEQILAEVDAVLADDSIPGFELIESGLDDAVFENGTS
jgi:anti-sigma factor RsiW